MPRAREISLESRAITRNFHADWYFVAAYSLMLLIQFYKKSNDVFDFVLEYKYVYPFYVTSFQRKKIFLYLAAHD